MLAFAQSRVLLAVVGIRGVLLIDVLTFSAAVVTLWAVRMPDSPAKTERVASVRLRLTYGFRYIGARPPLRTLAVLYVLINVVGAVGLALLAPLTLARSGGSEVALGSVMAALARAALSGVLCSDERLGWPEKPDARCASRTFYGLHLRLRPDRVGDDSFDGAGGRFLHHLLFAPAGQFAPDYLANLCARDVQGRVFAARQALGQSATPIVMLGAGPLADALSLDLALAPLGPGAGMVFLFLLTALLGVLVAVIGLALPGVRGVEQALEMTS